MSNNGAYNGSDDEDVEDFGCLSNAIAVACILILFLFSGCARVPIFNVATDAAQERSALRIVVNHYELGQYSCEDFATLISLLVNSEQSDSLLEHTYR